MTIEHVSVWIDRQAKYGIQGYGMVQFTERKDDLHKLKLIPDTLQQP